MLTLGVPDLALRALCPTNRLILDTTADSAALPGAYVQIPAQPLSELLADGDASVHPAFLINGVQKDIYIGKYQGVAHNNRIYSLPGETPKSTISLDNYVSYCRNKGAGHHCFTAAERAFLALWCKKNNTMPYGNNNHGKDSRETAYLAIPATYGATGAVEQVLTGTGPVTWSHNKQLDGIWDLNGNIWEWCAGMRLVYSELQLIPYNNAADPDVDMSATSAEWKAINANATSYNDLYITPNGSGTTANSVKLDMVSNNWQWRTTVADASTANRGKLFAAVTASGLSDFCTMFLRAMALLPESGVDYDGDWFYAVNGAEERCAIAGGDTTDGVNCGVFSLRFYNARNHMLSYIGGRPAYYE